MGVKTRKLGNINDSLIQWQAKVTSDGSTVTTMVAGRGYFVDNTSAAGIVKLPTSASAGDTIAIKDYAGNFGTNSLTIQRNGHKIQNVTNDAEIITNRASVSLVYVDATKGWLYTNESNVADLQKASYVSATGGTISTVSTNFKVHAFTGDGNFVVSCAGNSAGNNKVDYLVVAGGGAGGIGTASDGGGGGGAGGYRESYTPAVSGSYTASPLKAACGAITVTAQTYPITVGAGGTQPGVNNDIGTKGSDSIFSTITSAGGGGGDGNGNPTPDFQSPTKGNGGSGGGGHQSSGAAGNTPPVSPPQGNNGGNGSTPTGTPSGAGGGGAGQTGGDVGNYNPGPNNAGAGGDGVTSGISGSNIARAGGGGGACSPGRPSTGSPGSGGSGGGGQGANGGTSGTANTGGGGGGAANQNSGSGGKGIVIIRYKFQ